MIDFLDARKLIEDTLVEFCSEYRWRFISDDDIDKFAREHPLVLVVSGREGLPIRKGG